LGTKIADSMTRVHMVFLQKKKMNDKEYDE
jgi:hypothetical protein